MLTLMSQHSCFTTKEAEIKDKLPTFFNFCTLSTYALSFFSKPRAGQKQKHCIQKATACLCEHKYSRRRLVGLSAAVKCVSEKLPGGYHKNH